MGYPPCLQRLMRALIAVILLNLRLVPSLYTDVKFDPARSNPYDAPLCVAIRLTGYLVADWLPTRRSMLVVTAAISVFSMPISS